VFQNRKDRSMQMEDTTSLEEQLSDVQRHVDHALVSAGRMVVVLKKAQKAARSGDLAALKSAIGGAGRPEQGEMEVV
jgi:hypothetical protein